MPDHARISDAEWDVMEVIWTLGKVPAARVIEELAAKRDWNHRTIRTMLVRLVDKGVLKREGSGQQAVYRAAIARDKCVRRQTRSFVEKVFGGDPTSLLVHFIDQGRISPEELEELKRILDEKTGGTDTKNLK